MVTDAAGRETTYSYDYNGNLTATIDANGITTSRQRYDALNRLTEQIDGMGESTHYTYDRVGRVRQISYPDATSVAYVYDAVGNVLRVTD